MTFRILTFVWIFVSIAAADRPNVVLIVADDLGYGELGCYGGVGIPTPNLDALAGGGIRFTDGYVTAPFCAASRAAIMTGRYQTRFGFEFNPIGAVNCEPGIGLPKRETTIAEQMKDAGYATGLIGKWHLGGTAEFHPQRNGFDEFYGFLHEGHFFVPDTATGVTTWLRRTALPDGGQGRWTSPDGRMIWSTHMGHAEPPYDADNPVMRSSQPVAESENLTDAFTREACDFIDRKSAQPFFLCLAYNAVHSPLQGEDAYMKKFSHIEDIHRRIFASMLSHLDDAVGRVIETIRENDLEQDTLIVFLSDNGGPTKELTSSNRPLRGGKGELYEGGIRVPFIVSWKDRIQPAVSQSPVIATDVMATAIELARSEPVAKTFDGVPFDFAASASKDNLNRPLFWKVGKKHAIRHGQWKMVRTGKTWQLYDLSRDIAESNDLAMKMPKKATELAALWDQWNAEQVDPLW